MTFPSPEEARARLDRLTPAERLTLTLLAKGLTPQEVAAERSVSLPTIRTQVKMAKRRLEVDQLYHATVVVAAALYG